MSPRNATPSLNTIREGLHLNPLVNIQIFQAINCPKTTFFELTQVSRWEESFLTFWFLKSTVSWADFIAALLQTWKDYKFVNFWLGSVAATDCLWRRSFWLRDRRHWLSLRRLNFRPDGGAPIVSYIRHQGSQGCQHRYPLKFLPKILDQKLDEQVHQLWSLNF